MSVTNIGARWDSGNLAEADERAGHQLGEVLAPSAPVAAEV